MTFKIDQYEVVHELGHGGMAHVLLAKTVLRDGKVKFCVIKIPNASILADARKVKMFEQEVTIALKLNDTHIISVFDAGYWRGMPYMVMEFVSGKNVSEFVAGMARAKQVIDWEIAGWITLEVAFGLKAAHTYMEAGKIIPIIHRDVSVRNTMISGKAGVYLMDFGLAKIVSEDSTTGFAKGAFRFCSPEQANGRFVTEKTDAFGLGTILWALLEGRDFRSEVPEERVITAAITGEISVLTRTGIPEKLLKVLRGLLEVDPDERMSVLRAITLLEEFVPSRRTDVSKLMAAGFGTEVTRSGGTNVSIELISPETMAAFEMAQANERIKAATTAQGEGTTEVAIPQVAVRAPAPVEARAPVAVAPAAVAPAAVVPAPVVAAPAAAAVVQVDSAPLFAAVSPLEPPVVAKPKVQARPVESDPFSFSSAVPTSQLASHVVDPPRLIPPPLGADAVSQQAPPMAPPLAPAITDELARQGPPIDPTQLLTQSELHQSQELAQRGQTPGPEMSQVPTPLEPYMVPSSAPHLVPDDVVVARPRRTLEVPIPGSAPVQAAASSEIAAQPELAGSVVIEPPDEMVVDGATDIAVKKPRWRTPMMVGGGAVVAVFLAWFIGDVLLVGGGERPIAEAQTLAAKPSRKEVRAASRPVAAMVEMPTREEPDMPSAPAEPRLDTPAIAQDEQVEQEPEAEPEAIEPEAIEPKIAEEPVRPRAEPVASDEPNKAAARTTTAPTKPTTTISFGLAFIDMAYIEVGGKKRSLKKGKLRSLKVPLGTQKVRWKLTRSEKWRRAKSLKVTKTCNHYIVVDADGPMYSCRKGK